MSEYRIIKRTFTDGTELFGVQKKWMFIWWNCYHEDAFVINCNNWMIDSKSGMFRELVYAVEFVKRKEGNKCMSWSIVK